MWFFILMFWYLVTITQLHKSNPNYKIVSKAFQARRQRLCFQLYLFAYSLGWLAFYPCTRCTWWNHILDVSLSCEKWASTVPSRLLSVLTVWSNYCCSPSFSYIFVVLRKNPESIPMKMKQIEWSFSFLLTNCKELALLWWTGLWLRKVHSRLNCWSTFPQKSAFTTPGYKLFTGPFPNCKAPCPAKISDMVHLFIQNGFNLVLRLSVIGPASINLQLGTGSTWP
jgi:hypothetical protein